MKKEEILEKSKAMGDEREQSVVIHSFGFSGCVIAILVVVFSIWNAYLGETFYGYAAILFAYLSTSQLYKFKSLKYKSDLAWGCLEAIIALLNTILFFIKG